MIETLPPQTTQPANPAPAKLTLADKICAAITGALLLLFFGLMFVVMVAMVWEAWDSPAFPDQDKHTRAWEARDDLPEGFKNEMRAKLKLLEEGEAPDNP